MIRKFFSRVALAGLAAAALVPAASYALVIDQSVTNGSYQIQAFDPIGQSFNATDANIGSIGVYIEPYNQFFNDPTMELALFSGAGDFSAGAKLISQVFTLPANFSDWLFLDVSGINFTAGNDYTIGAFNDTAQWGISSNIDSDTYVGGNMWLWGNAFVGDLKFKVLPKTVASVPESGSLGLFGVGLMLLGLARRKSSAI